MFPFVFRKMNYIGHVLLGVRHELLAAPRLLEVRKSSTRGTGGWQVASSCKYSCCRGHRVTRPNRFGILVLTSVFGSSLFPNGHDTTQHGLRTFHHNSTKFRLNIQRSTARHNAARNRTAPFSIFHFRKSHSKHHGHSIHITFHDFE